MQISIEFLLASILLALATFGSLLAFSIAGILMIAGILEDDEEGVR